MLLPGTEHRGAPIQRKIVPMSIIANTRAITNAAADTARIIISAEEKLRQRVRSILRVAVATIFFGISGLISLGANATAAFAKKVSPDRGKSPTSHLNVKRTAKHVSKH